MLGDIMYETATNYNSCEFDTGKWDKPGKSESPSTSWLSQSIRLDCAACDRRRSNVCHHQTTTAGSNTKSA